MLPLFSVIIPNFNHGKYLSRAVESVKSQTFENWEIIIVDNHSTDETDQVIQPWICDKIHLLKINNNGIIAASRNFGILHSKGEWIAFLDADDWWAERKLEACFKLISKGTSDIIYHDVYLVQKIKEFNSYRRTWCRKLDKDASHDLMNNGNTLVNSSVVVRKSVLNRISGISEERNCVSWEDYDTWLRMAESNYIFEKLKGIYGYYWIGGGNISNPQQEINNVEAFVLKYLPNEKSNTIPWWCHYSNGLSYNIEREYEKSLTSFMLALRAKSILINKLKTFIRLLEIFIKINLIKFNS